MLEDRAIADQFRIIAYDLPFHGKSLPPEGFAWWTEKYRLTKDFLMQLPLALGRELGLDRPSSSSISSMLASSVSAGRPGGCPRSSLFLPISHAENAHRTLPNAHATARSESLPIAAARAPADAMHQREKAHGPCPDAGQHTRNLNLSRALGRSLERKTRFELATPSLARTCSTAELLPRACRIIAVTSGTDNEFAKSTPSRGTIRRPVGRFYR